MRRGKEEPRKSADCRGAYVLETGKITVSGTGQELASSSAIQEAYLGGA